MSKKRTNDPFWWTLFGAGGTFSAFFIPVHVLVLGIAVPIGWLAAPDYESLLHLAQHPISRIYLFALISLSLFHWAHRFRYTLYDGLMLKHLELYIVIFCYGGALAGTVIAGFLVWTI
jgi:fumarate reductase subunit D